MSWIVNGTVSRASVYMERIGMFPFLQIGAYLTPQVESRRKKKD
jgi:hypothetical protein